MIKKRTLIQFTIVACALPAVSANAASIVQITTSAGPNGTANITGNATIQTFVAGGVTYAPTVGLTVDDPTEPARLWANTLSDPGSATAAISDLDLGTGALNNGTDSEYVLAGQTFAADTTIFILGNGNGAIGALDAFGNSTGSGGTTPFGNVSFLDATNSVIGTLSGDFFFQDPGTNAVRAPNILSFDYARDGNPLNGRTVSGAIFSLGDVTFTSGGIADIAGFTLASASTDINDVGIAVAVPEPSSLLLLGLGGLLIARRRRIV